MKHAAAALLVCAMTLLANAQPVYRCGSEYAQAPCPQGKLIDATDPRSAAQRAEALRVAAGERRLGAEMQRERLAEEAARRPALAVSLGGPATKPDATGERARAKQKKRASPKRAAGADFVVLVSNGKKQRSRS